MVVISRRSSRIAVVPLSIASVVWLFKTAPSWYLPNGVLLALALLLYVAVDAEVRIVRGELVFGWIFFGRKRIIYRRIGSGELASFRVEEAEGVEGGTNYQILIKANGRMPISAGAWERKSDAEKACERIRRYIGTTKFADS